MLIKGENLNPRQQSIVLNAFGYRWTVENEGRARNWLNDNTPTNPSKSDKQWLADHAFHFIKDGSRMDARMSYCEPAFMADGDE